MIPGLAFSFPPSMDIGTFAIDNYAGNGGGMSNLMFQIASGQSVYSGAMANVPDYVASLSGGTSGPRLALDRRDNQVTKAAITSKGAAWGDREYCDFVFYGGHGLSGGLYLGAGADYIGASPTDLGMGGNGSTGYNRWFLAGSCLLFNQNSPAATWSGAFKGLKAMLGFESAIFDNNMSAELYNEFWLNWTWRAKSLQIAFFDAQVNYGYAHLYPTAGLKPGCLSAQVPAGYLDYCREAFRWVAQNYTAATPQTGTYYNRRIGNPIY